MQFVTAKSNFVTASSVTKIFVTDLNFVTFL